MKRQPIYFYLRSSWKKRSWRPLKLKCLLVHDRTLLLLRIEKLLGPPPKMGEYFANSFLRLILEATAIQNISDDAVQICRPLKPKVAFLKRPAPRPGRHFYAPPGTKLRTKLEVQIA